MGYVSISMGYVNPIPKNSLKSTTYEHFSKMGIILSIIISIYCLGISSARRKTEKLHSRKKSLQLKGGVESRMLV